jgi:hypothetical protein
MIVEEFQFIICWLQRFALIAEPAEDPQQRVAHAGHFSWDEGGPLAMEPDP